jgi:TetR/AcrR family transcriptional regulator, regulator of cefoperazone and chloramphenicol sensitivity
MSGLDVTKARLLEAAGREFAEKGYEGATIRSICTRAGVNPAAVNYHFGDKDQLYVRSVLQAHRCGGTEMIPDEEFFRVEPRDQLRRFIGFFLKNVLAVHEDEVDWPRMLMLRELIRPTTASGTLVEEVIRPRFQRLLTILKAICPAAEEKRLHVIAFSIIGQLLHYRMARPITERLIGAEEFASFDVEFVANHIAAFSLAALGLGPPLDEAGLPSAAEPAPAANGEKRR